jgi:maltose/moltooligosaccharide transporter
MDGCWFTWILDAGNNTAMEPYRAFIADKLDDKQMPLGFQMQSFLLVSKHIHYLFFSNDFYWKTGSTWVYASFFLGAVCSIGSILVDMKTTKEIPPTTAELEHLRSRKERF